MPCSKARRRDAWSVGGSIAALLVFGAPFLGAGVGLAWWSTTVFREWRAAQTWEPVEARIRSVELATRRRRHRNEASGVSATYDYAFAGRQFSGSRLTLVEGGNDQSYRQRYAKLEQLRAIGTPTRCYVDPRRPEQSVLDRASGPGPSIVLLIVSLGFGSIGFVVALTAVRWIRLAHRVKLLRAANPAEPWRWRPDWVAGVVRCREWTSPNLLLGWAFVLLVAILGLAICATCSPVGIMCGGALALIGVSLTLLLVCGTRYRRSEFRLAEVPARVGARLAGELVITGVRRIPERVELALKCNRIWCGRRGPDETIWGTSQVARPRTELDVRIGSVPVDIPIPAQCPGTRDQDDAIEWELAVKDPDRRLGLRLNFPVPVFASDAVAPAPASSRPVALAVGGARAGVKPVCPQCGRLFPDADLNVAADTALCRACGDAFTVAEIISRAADDLGFEQPPRGAWLHDDGRELRIGATTRSAAAFALVPFMCMWSGFSLGWIYGMQMRWGFSWLLSFFGLPFVYGTVVIGKHALMMVAGRIEVRLRGDEGVLFAGIGPLGRRVRFRASQVTGVRRSWTGGGRGGNWEIVLDGSKLAFGGDLSIARQTFLLKALRARLGRA